MKKTDLPSFVLWILFISTVLSCTDHLLPDPLPNRQRIKSLTQVLPETDGATFVSSFAYNPQNQLEFIYSSPIPASIPGKRAITRYSYDSNKNISQVYRSFDDGVNEETYQYTTGSFGQVSQLDYNGGGSDIYNMFFNFNGQQLNTSSRRFKFSSVSYIQDIVYHFTGLNLSSADYTTTVMRNVPATSSGTLAFTYDDKMNPFFGMPVIPAPNGPPRPTSGNFNYYTFSGGLDNLIYLNRNNVLSETSSSPSEKTYEYTYNSDGLPLTRITKRKNTQQNQTVVEETLAFEYETY